MISVTSFCKYILILQLSTIANSENLSALNGLFDINRARRVSLVYKSYQGTIYCSPSDLIRNPSNISEAQAIVLDAIKGNQKVKAFGSRHSITDTICTDGIPVSMKNINHTILNDDGTATFGAGIEMTDALEFLQRNKRSLIHVPAYGGITIGGALGTGAHGSSLLHPNTLSDLLIRLTVIDGLGEIRIIESPDEINAFRVHLGLLGLVFDATLKTVPLFKMKVENTLAPETILLNGTALTWARTHDWFQMWWFPSSEDVVVSKGVYTNDSTLSGDARTNLIADLDPATITAGSLALETVQQFKNKPGMYAFQHFTKLSLYRQVVGKPPLFSEDGDTFSNPAIGYAWRLQSNRCSKFCVWDNNYESILPEENSMAFEISELPAVIKTIKDIRVTNPAAFPLIGLMIRFSPSSDGLMSIASGRETVTIEWATAMRRNPFITSKESVGAYQAISQAMLRNHGGRPHWGKNGLYFHNKDTINAANPNRPAFVSAMNKFDPNGIFLNKFGRRVRGDSDEMDVDPRVTHCALQDYCVCSLKKHCAFFQHCENQTCQDVFNIRFPPHDPTHSFLNLTDILSWLDFLKV